MTTAQAAPADTRLSRADAEARWLRRLGWLLLAVAVVVLLFPWRWNALTGVGTMDNQTFDSAGYERYNAVWPVDPPRIKAGDRIVTSTKESNQAAARNKVAADRRGLALLLAVPGAFLVGRYRRPGANSE